MPPNGDSGATRTGTRPTKPPAGPPPGVRRSARQRGEIRLPAAAATLAAIALYALLPQKLVVGPRYVIPGLELLLLVVLVAANPVRMSRQNRITRGLAIALVLLIAVTNLVALTILLTELVSRHSASGPALLVAALQVWLTDVIVFALAYWEIDRGGPVPRHLADRRDLPMADFRFPQDENLGTVVEVDRGSSQRSGWMPTFVDYLYMSLTNSSAFSPTDTMPLSTRAKLLMGAESTAALITSVVVIARGVGSLQ
jgi:uncharacterized membrane protein